MTEPTKEEYKALADILGDALDHCDGVGLYGDNLLTAYKAFRLAANLPSEEEREALVEDLFNHHCPGVRIIEDDRKWYRATVDFILERIRSVK